MTPQDLDRILGDDPPVAVSPGFDARVLRAVRAPSPSRVFVASQSLWPVVAAVSIFVPASIAAQAIDTTVPFLGVSIPIKELLVVTFGSTIALAAWCGGLFRTSG